MTSRYSAALSPHDPREFCYQRSPLENKRAQGSRVRGRTHSLACKIKQSTRAWSPQVRRNTRLSLRDGFTAYIALSPVSRACLPPSSPRSFASRELDTSVGVSGPHDFAVRRHALSSATPPASTASRRNVRDDCANAPLDRGGTG